MDKETLSHYGWIVILVLILSVLLALATPFGTFVADGFKATYAGFEMVGSNAMNIAGIVTGNDNKIIQTDDGESIKINVEGDVDIEYDEDTGEITISGKTEDAEPDVVLDDVVEIIDFSYGTFKTDTTIVPNTIQQVPYEETYTELKEIPQYYGGITGSVPLKEGVEVDWPKLEDEEMYCGRTYIVYTHCGKHISSQLVDYNTREPLGPVIWGKALLTFCTKDAAKDNVDDIILLAKYLTDQNPVCGHTYHIAKWDGSKYVAVDYDEAIKNATITEVKTRTVYKQVSIPGSINTKYVFIPAGTLQAEKGMTWGEWLTSDYNTTGETTPNIKTADFQPVSYDDVIIAEKEYGFVQCEVSGIWTFNENVNLTLGEIGSAYYEEVTYTSSDKTLHSFWLTPAEIGYGAGIFPMTIYKSDTGWSDEIYRTVDFGSTKQPVTEEFYEWLFANATQQ